MAGLILVAIGQIADLMTFLAVAAIAPHNAAETNVAVGALLEIGMPLVVLFKLGLMGLTLWIVSWLRSYRIAWVNVAVVSIPTAAGLAGAAANITTLLVLLRT